MGTDFAAQGTARLRLLIGLVARTKSEAIDLIARHLRLRGYAARVGGPSRQDRLPPDRAWRDPARHAATLLRVLRGWPQKLLVRTPFTPRPFDHTMSNALGHAVVVTNRGLHTSSSVNSQQNRLTPDWSDIVTREVPGEAFYLYDPDTAGVVLADLSSSERRTGLAMRPNSASTARRPSA